MKKAAAVAADAVIKKSENLSERELRTGFFIGDEWKILKKGEQK